MTTALLIRPRYMAVIARRRMIPRPPAEPILVFLIVALAMMHNPAFAAFVSSGMRGGAGASPKGCWGWGTSTTTRSSPMVIANKMASSPTSPTSPVAPPAAAPLSPTSFAGIVERGMVERFGADDVARIVESWRLLDGGYEHREAYGGTSTTTGYSTDQGGGGSNFVQHASSYVPGLSAKTFWEVDDFDWCSKLADRYDEIREEFLGVTGDADRLTAEGNNVWAGALTEDASSYGEGWRTLVLLDRGTWDAVNCRLFPATARAVRDCGVPAVEVFFASMKPHTDIKMHSDFTNFVLTSHLALDIPYSGSNKCRLTVGDDTRQWINGEVMLFDTSIMHDAVNESDKTRYILMLRLWHPDLTNVERQALQFIYDCLEVPELVSEDPAERFLAEQKVKLLRSFPDLDVATRKKGSSGKNRKKGTKGNRRSAGKGFGV